MTDERPVDAVARGRSDLLRGIWLPRTLLVQAAVAAAYVVRVTLRDEPFRVGGGGFAVLEWVAFIGAMLLLPLFLPLLAFSMPVWAASLRYRGSPRTSKALIIFGAYLAAVGLAAVPYVLYWSVQGYVKDFVDVILALLMLGIPGLLVFLTPSGAQAEDRSRQHRTSQWYWKGVATLCLILALLLLLS
jgi:hypothetical protein